MVNSRPEAMVGLLPLEVQLWSRDGIYLGDLGEREDWIWCGASINYHGNLRVNNPLIRPYLLGGWHRGYP